MRKKVVTLKSVEKASHLIRILEMYKHNGFPITDQNDKGFKGIILRSTIITLLNEKICFQFKENSQNEYEHVLNYLSSNIDDIEICRPLLKWYKFNKS